MDTGSLALLMVSLLIAVYSINNARQRGAKIRPVWMILIFVSGLLIPLLLFFFLIWRGNAGLDDVFIRTLF